MTFLQHCAEMTPLIDIAQALLNTDRKSHITKPSLGKDASMKYIQVGKK
jgi:hypothetical protein